LNASIIAALVTIFLTIAGVLIIKKWQMGKSKTGQLSQLLALILEAAEDGKVSEEEFQGLFLLLGL
jgi:predicted peroxiredoxin